jgi:hypothetical protein
MLVLSNAIVQGRLIRIYLLIQAFRPRILHAPTTYPLMNFRMRLLSLVATVCVVVVTVSIASAQNSRVERYGVTTFQSTWDSLRTGPATRAVYIGGPNEGIYSIPIPFDFPFDGQVIEQGTMISVGANGAISLVNAPLLNPLPTERFIGNATFPALIGPFAGDIKQGADAATSAVDTFGYYQLTGAAPGRMLTIEWRGFHLRGGGSGAGQVDTLAAMQVKLYETTGMIEFIYRDHGLDLPSKFPVAPKASIGLNGLTQPTFSTNVYASDTKVIPATDLRWTPGTASVDVQDRGSLQIYPNPTTGRAKLQLGDGETLKRVVASDALGVERSIPADASGGLDLRELGSGLHILRIETNLGSFVRSLTVVR